MDGKLITSVLKKIEATALNQLDVTKEILTSVKVTNTILSREIGGELKKQTGLLTGILQALKSSSEDGTKSSVNLGGDASTFFKILRKTKSAKRISQSINLITQSLEKFAKVINSMDSDKVKAVTEFFSIGKNIKQFAIAIAVAAPFMVVGMVTLGALWLWSKLFMSIGEKQKDMADGAKALLFMSLSVATVVFTIIAASYILGNPMQMLGAFLLVGASILLLAGTFWLLSKIGKGIDEGVKSMLWVALTTAIIVGIVIAASYFIGNDPTNMLVAFGIVAGSMLVLGLTFWIISKVASNIMMGAIAMIIASVAVGIITYSIIQYSKADVSGEDVLILSGFIVGLGVAMAGAGLIAPVIIAGAGAMILVGAALYLITDSLVNFKKAEWTQSDSENLSFTIVSVVSAFGEAFSDIGPADMLQILAGTVLLGQIGNSLSSFAQGLSAFASGQAPLYEVNDKGELVLVGTTPLDADLGKRVGDTIKALITPLTDDDSILAKLGEGQGFLFDGPIGNGIDLLGRLGNSLSGFAKGLGSMANMEFVSFKNKDGVLSVDESAGTSGKIDPSKIGNAIKALVGSLTKPLEELGSKDGFFLDSDFENGLDMLERLGAPLNAFADSAVKLGKKKIDSKRLQDNIGTTLKIFTESLSKDALSGIDYNNGKKVLDGFNYYADAVVKLQENSGENIGNMFEKMADSINDIDTGKLKQLNSLMSTMNEFAYNMKGSFGDLEDVLDKLVDVIAEMNGVTVKTSGSSTSSSSTDSTEVNIIPITDKLQELIETLNSGIEVEVQNDYLSK